MKNVHETTKKTAAVTTEFVTLLPPVVTKAAVFVLCGSTVTWLIIGENIHIDSFHLISFMCFKCDIIDFQYTCLYAQDLECDVSVEDDNRQEWIFTLYDFDNSGKVTKEVCMCLKSFLSL